MVVFFNTFLSYLLLVIISLGLIVVAVLLGKKLREMKDAKDAAALAASADSDGDKK